MGAFKDAYKTNADLKGSYRTGATAAAEASEKGLTKLGARAAKTLNTGAKLTGRFGGAVAPVVAGGMAVDEALSGNWGRAAVNATAALPGPVGLAGKAAAGTMFLVDKVANHFNRRLDAEQEKILGNDVVRPGAQPTLKPATPSPTAQPTLAQAPSVQPGAQPTTVQDLTNGSGPTIMSNPFGGGGGDVLADGRQKILQASDGLRRALNPEAIKRIMAGEGDISGLSRFGDLLATTAPARMEMAQAKGDYKRNLEEAKLFVPQSVELMKAGMTAGKGDAANNLALAKLQDERVKDLMGGIKGQVVSGKDKNGNLVQTEDVADAEARRNAMREVLGEQGVAALASGPATVRQKLTGDFNALADATKPFNDFAREHGGTVGQPLARGFQIAANPANWADDVGTNNGVGWWNLLRGNLTDDKVVEPLIDGLDKAGKPAVVPGKRMLLRDWQKANGGIDMNKALMLAHTAEQMRKAQGK